MVCALTVHRSVSDSLLLIYDPSASLVDAGLLLPVIPVHNAILTPFSRVMDYRSNSVVNTWQIFFIEESRYIHYKKNGLQGFVLYYTL